MPELYDFELILTGEKETKTITGRGKFDTNTKYNTLDEIYASNKRTKVFYDLQSVEFKITPEREYHMTVKSKKALSVEHNITAYVNGWTVDEVNAAMAAAAGVPGNAEFNFYEGELNATWTTTA